MKNILLVACLGVLASTGLSACGGGAGTCGNTAACGGDLVGTWKVTSSCVTINATMFDDMCPTASVRTSDVSVKGSMTFNADLTYTSTATLMGKAVITLPASCLTGPGGTVTCAQLNALFALDPSTAGVTCVGTSSCTCTGPLSDAPSNETGTYTTTAAGILTQTATGGTPEESAYCVKGTTLTDSPSGASTMMGQESGTITLTKQ
jgi:hypothetical protein